MQRGGVIAQATSYGNPVTFTPESRAIYAVDASGGVDDVNTAWTTAAFGPDKGEKLRLTFPAGVTSDHVTLLQPQTGRPDRWITSVKLTLDNGYTANLQLGRASRKTPGQTFTFPKQTFHRATIEITGDNVGHQYVYQTASSVGFANVSFGPQTPRVTEYVELPRDLLRNLGSSSKANQLAIVLDRERISPYNSLRSDPEAFLARTWTLPDTRSFAVSGTAKLDSRATPSVIDTALGMPDAAHGGVDVRESRHLTGAASQRATAAIDGNAATHWTTGFLTSVKDYAQYQTAKPVSFDHLNLTVVSDAHHSVPTRLTVKVDGQSVKVKVPKITKTTPIGSTTTVRVPLGRTLTGSKIRFTITGEHARLTHDWYSGNDIDLPISIAEWGVNGLRAKTPAADAKVPNTCTSKVLLVDNKPVPVRFEGTVGDALDGRPLKVAPCGGQAKTGVELKAGRHYLVTAPGASAGFDTNQLVLRSAAGGAADTATGTLVPAAATAGPKVTVDNQSRTSYDLTVTGADKKFWLVLGQSQSLGWHATVNGKSLGSSTLVDGYANGWQIDPSGSRTLHVELTWTPQNVVWIAIGLSLLAVIGCLALALAPIFRRGPAPVVEGDLPVSRPSVPLPFVLRRALTYRGATPGVGVTTGVTIAAAVVGGAIVGYWAAPITGVATLLCLRFRRARPILTVGAPACVLVAAAYYCVFVAFRDTYLRFGWPSWFSRVAWLGWFAVLALAIDTIVDRCWTRRWWPSSESED